MRASAARHFHRRQPEKGEQADCERHSGKGLQPEAAEEGRGGICDERHSDGSEGASRIVAQRGDGSDDDALASRPLQRGKCGWPGADDRKCGALYDARDEHRGVAGGGAPSWANDGSVAKHGRRRIEQPTGYEQRAVPSTTRCKR